MPFTCRHRGRSRCRRGGRAHDGAATVFTDKFNSVTVQVAPEATAPTLRGAGRRGAADPGRVPGFQPDVRSVERTAGTAVLITYRRIRRRTR